MYENTDCLCICLFGVFCSTFCHFFIFTHTETSPLMMGWRDTNFDPCSAMLIEQFSVPHLIWHETSLPQDQWHSYLLPNVWRCSCRYLILRLRSVVVMIWTSNLPHARQTLEPTAPPPRPSLLFELFKASRVITWITNF